MKRGRKRKWDGGRCGLLIVQSGSEPFGLWGVTNGIRANLHGHGHVRVRGVDMGFIARVGPTGVHDMAHVSTLGARLRVLRGNVPGHRLPSCGCVGLTRTSVPLRGVYVTSGPVWNLAHSGPYTS